jgi:hypothetical protein
VPDGSIDVGSLEGDALTRWYLRSPAEIEQEHQDAAAKRYQDFFYGTSDTDPDAESAREAPGADHDVDPDLAVSLPSTSQTVVPDFTWAQVGPNRFRSERLAADERGGAPSTLKAMSYAGPTPPEDLGDIRQYQDAGPSIVASSQLSLAPQPVAQVDGSLRRPPTVAFGHLRSPAAQGASPAAPVQAQAFAVPHPTLRGPIHLGPATPPLPTFFSSLFGGPVPLTNPEGQVVGYYDHQAAKAGLGITAQYAQIAPWLQPAGWMDGLIASGGPRVALSAVAPAARVVESGLKGPLNFLEREAWQGKAAAEQTARNLWKAAKPAIRREARDRFTQANGISAAELGGKVHHSDPLEYAFLTPDADPNRLASLWGLPDEAHLIASNAWTAFRAGLKGRAPTLAEKMAAKLRIDRMVEPYILRPGVPRPGPKPK